jgi:hypothetical protein
MERENLNALFEISLIDLSEIPEHNPYSFVAAILMDHISRIGKM